MPFYQWFHFHPVSPEQYQKGLRFSDFVDDPNKLHNAQKHVPNGQTSWLLGRHYLWSGHKVHALPKIPESQQLLIAKQQLENTIFGIQGHYNQSLCLIYYSLKLSDPFSRVFP